MSRSLFVRIFALLAVAAAGALLLARLLEPLSLGQAAGLLLLWCGAVAFLAVRWLRRGLRPLELAANQLSAREQVKIEPTQDELRGLSLAIASASASMRDSLAKAGESRRELEALLDSMQDAVVSVDAAGRIQWSNERMQRLIPGPAVAGAVRVGHALVQTVRDPDVLACVQAALQEGVVKVRRATLLSPGRIFEVIASPMPGGGAVAVLHDVSRIEQVERTQRDFVANVSHELRTPLTSISGYVETLLDHEALISEQGREFLETILKNANRMNRLTEDLLVMAQVEAASVNLHSVAIAADALVREAVRGMSGLVQENEAQLEIGEVCPAAVFADPDSVLQVLGNLIENAIKYGRPPEGVARVVLSARLVHEAGEAVEFSVRDFGPGIASEHLDRIFERFYRVDKARSRASGGTGLGLSIARHMVQVQGGSIRAESQINQGTTFLFTLPAAQHFVKLEADNLEATDAS